MSTPKQVPRQVAAPAAEFDHETIAFADRGQQSEHSRRARVCVEPKPQVVHMRKIGPIYG